MKAILTIFLMLLSTIALFSQNSDQIIKLNGDILEVNITKVTEEIVEFNYPNESLVNEISKNAIHKIIFASGRIEDVNQKIEYTEGEVIITHNEDDVIGLHRIGEISAKTSNMALNSAAQAERKVYEKLQKEAIEVGADLILIVQFTNNVADQRYNTYQATARAIAYRR